MKNIILSFESKSLRRIAVSFLAVFFLVINTACGNAGMTANAEQPNSGNLTAVPGQTNPDELTAGQSTNLYKPIAPPEGGMNNYSDVDPRLDTSEADAKAEQLIKKANLNKPTNPIKEVQKELDKKGPQERVQDLSKNLSRSAQQKADQVSKTAQEDFGNVQENVNSIKSDVKSAVDNIGQKVQDKTDDLKKAAQKTADAIVNKAEKAKSKV